MLPTGDSREKVMSMNHLPGQHENHDQPELDKIEPATDPSAIVPPRLSMRDRANAPSDTVGTGSYAAVSCSVLAVLATVLLVAGLLLYRWLF
jgi:hypothetical protein